jgi:hypothetical protein
MTMNKSNVIQIIEQSLAQTSEAEIEQVKDFTLSLLNNKPNTTPQTNGDDPLEAVIGICNGSPDLADNHDKYTLTLLH